jgi:4-hydroxythreonine-4-phosphate dehydrogenase
LTLKILLLHHPSEFFKGKIVTDRNSDQAHIPPTIAFAMGDPAGISPELTAILLNDGEVRAAARFVVFGDRRILAEGAQIAGLTPDVDFVSADSACEIGERPVFVDLAHLDPRDVKRGEATPEGGAFALENFRRALLMANEGRADAVFFTPFNKKAMRYVYPNYDDEIRYAADITGFKGAAREFNVLDNLWNCRVTSHIPLSAVAGAITIEGIVDELILADGCMREAGFVSPRIAVAGLNPHAGDGGNFGNEEIEIIEPAVRLAVQRGINAEGPYPADTVYLRARNGQFDGVLSMYHDQGQVAMKLMGFDRGVTMMGGFPFPICTPAHGTAYDIAGKGIANPGASKAAILLAARMAARNLGAKKRA